MSRTAHTGAGSRDTQGRAAGTHRGGQQGHTPVHFHISRLYLSIHWVSVEEPTPFTDSAHPLGLVASGTQPTRPTRWSAQPTRPPDGLPVLVTVESIECSLLIHPQTYV